MRFLGTLMMVAAFSLTACDTGNSGGSFPLTQAGYQQPCDPAAGASACQATYQSQLRGPVALTCFQHNNGQALCTYQCTPQSVNECDAPSPKCNGRGFCADPGEHGQNGNQGPQ